MTELCKDCSGVVADPLRTPMHLVHPEHGAHMFQNFDVAVCPTCSTRWFRDQKGAVRMERRAKISLRDTWNEAIEAAAKMCDQGADAIRALKR